MAEGCPWPGIALRCSASGAAARLSIGRDGFESRTARHFRSVAQPGSALRSERRGRWFKSSHSDHFLRAMTRISRSFSARRQHWCAARSYKPGQRTAVDGRDRNPGRRPSNKQEVDMQAHPALVLNADFRPLSYFPLSLLSWQDAITAVFKDHVSVVAEYDKMGIEPIDEAPTSVRCRAEGLYPDAEAGRVHAVQ